MAQLQCTKTPAIHSLLHCRTFPRSIRYHLGGDPVVKLSPFSKIPSKVLFDVYRVHTYATSFQ